MLLTGFILSLRHQAMQQYIGKLAAQHLSRELGAEITIEGLYFKPFTALQLTGLYVSDQQGDTLFHAPEAMAGLDLTRLFKRQISLEEIRLRDARMDLHINAQGESNLAFLIDYFTPSTRRD
ncbi:MAG TPA: AsmA family protein, partial [Sphingobacteriaceae bacterium]|nr:AsmA family protein [Sphingobacteriaceae bacterium]